MNIWVGFEIRGYNIQLQLERKTKGNVNILRLLYEQLIRWELKIRERSKYLAAVILCEPTRNYTSEEGI